MLNTGQKVNDEKKIGDKYVWRQSSFPCMKAKNILI